MVLDIEVILVIVIPNNLRFPAMVSNFQGRGMEKKIRV